MYGSFHCRYGTHFKITKRLSKRTAPTGRRKKVQDEKECHRWSCSCLTVTWHRDKVIMKLFSMTIWSRSFSLWQGDHGASPWLSTLLQRHDHQHFSSKLGKIFMDSDEMCECVCVCVCLQIIYWPFFFPLCNWVYTGGTSSGMLVLMADQLMMMMMVVVVVVHERSNPENWRLWDCNHNTSST